MTASKIWLALAAAGLTAGATGTAYALPDYGDLTTPPGYYAGSGPANGNFTIDRTDGIEVGLRAKDRQTVASIDGSSGIYLARAGMCPPNTGFCGGPAVPKALWNYEFSVNTANSTLALGTDLSAYRIEIRVDTDPSGGTSFVILDAYANWSDNEFINGAGPKRVSSDISLLDDTPQAGEDGVQQSVNPLFPNSGFQPGFDPFQAGLYEIQISVYAATDTGPGATALASTDITVQVVPEPASALLFGLGLAGLGFIRRRKVAA